MKDGSLIAKCGWQTVLSHIVVALQHREAAERSRDADGGEAGMTGGWVRAAVVHGGTDGNASRHFVIDQPADFQSQPRSQLCVRRVVAAGGMRIDAAGEVAFELLDDATG